MDDRNHIHVYNFLMRQWEYEIELHCRLTSISISKDSRHLLVNLQKDQAQLFDLFSREVVQYYTGHTGGEYMIRSALGGANESFVLSGSEGTFMNCLGTDASVDANMDSLQTDPFTSGTKPVPRTW